MDLYGISLYSTPLHFPIWRGIVPRIDAAFPRWIAISILWRRNAADRRSPDTHEIRLPSSATKLSVSSPQVPRVSNAIGTKVFYIASAWYFVFLWVSASDAADPAARDVLIKCDVARVTEHVKSHTRQRPCFQGTSVTPSGHFLSSLSIPWYTRATGISVLRKARVNMSLRCDGMRDHDDIIIISYRGFKLFLVIVVNHQVM